MGDKGASRVFDIPTGAIGWQRPLPTQPTNSEAATALALAIELMRALRDRGVLSRAEIDDILAEAGGHFASSKVSQLIEAVRADLDRRNDDD